MKALIFAAIAILQLGIPLAMIAKYEAVLAFGEEYKFRCAPVDPVDHLRGRYVALSFDATGFSADNAYSNRVVSRWAELAVDENGFAYAKSSSERKPSSGVCLEYAVRWGMVELPFDKYFMNEAAAPEAEDAYRKSTLRPNGAGRDWKSDSYLTVKVWHGYAVGERLFIGGKPVEELIGKGRR